MPNKTAFLWMLLIISYGSGYGQSIEKSQLFRIIPFANSDSGIVEQQYLHAGCKNFKQDFKLIHQSSIEPSTAQKPNAFPKPKFLIIHGNVSYDFFYRSRIDTPFVQENLQQHTERVWLNVLVNEKYPINVGFTARQSNSPFFRDLFSVNLGFDKNKYRQLYREKLLKKFDEKLAGDMILKSLQSTLAKKQKQFEKYNKEILSSAYSQKMIEQKEKALNDSINDLQNINTGEFNFDNLSGSNKDFSLRERKFNTSNFRKDYTDSFLLPNNKKDLNFESTATLANGSVNKDSFNFLKIELDHLKNKYDSTLSSHQMKLSKLRALLQRADNGQSIQDIANDHQLEVSKPKNVDKLLSNVDYLNVGRSVVDYTELTAQNVMLTGINTAFTGKKTYTALAVGRIDFGFRDFLGREQLQRKQHMMLARYGKGDLKKRSIIFTVFGGKKNNYTDILSDSARPAIQLFGYSVEVNLKKNNEHYITAEFAKSTISNSEFVPGTTSKDASALIRFSEMANAGLNFKAGAKLAKTGTNVSAFYRKTGEKFQSFSLFTVNSNQESWQLRVQQPLLKGKVNLTAMLRQNDFANPFTDKTFKTSTVFKTFQASFNMKGLPIVQVGYYPGTQIFLVDKTTLRENAYYILNGSLFYNYRFKGEQFSTSMVLNQFFNKATDTGFIIYSGKSFLLSQQFITKQYQVNAGFQYNDQEGMVFHTTELGGEYNLKMIRVGGSLKRSDVNGGANYIGAVARLSTAMGKFGTIQLQYEKSYLPTINRTLFPVETGRIGWFKIF